MVGEACLPSNAYSPRTPDYTLWVHVSWSKHSDSSFMSLDYGLGTMTATTFVHTYTFPNCGGYTWLIVTCLFGVQSSVIAIKLSNYLYKGFKDSS